MATNEEMLKKQFVRYKKGNVSYKTTYKSNLKSFNPLFLLIFFAFGPRELASFEGTYKCLIRNKKY